MIRHAGLIAIRQAGAWLGVLIEGPSGAGKSDLALRALDHGFRLVADDRVELWVSDGRLFGAPPAPLAGLIEARGLDILTIGALPLAEVRLAVRCGDPERLPDPQATDILGVALPTLTIQPREASAAVKLSRAVARFDGDPKRRM